LGALSRKNPIGFGGGQANFYAYVYDNTTNMIDPLGLAGMGWTQLRLGFAGLLILAFCQSFGCTRQTKTPQEPTAMPSEKKQYPFAINDTQMRALVENTKNIEIGDTRNNVKTLLGDPSLDLAYGPKERNTVSGRFIAYQVTKSAADIANNHDQVVTLYFDAGDHLEKITSNVPGIASRP
jgi:hypothetical protein